MLGDYSQANNIRNIAVNATGRKTIFLDMRENPQRVTLNTDAPGDAVAAQITYVTIDFGESEATRYIQIDFGGAVHFESNQVFNAVARCVQVPLIDHRLNFPIAFCANHVPQHFTVSVYTPGEPASLIPLGPKGCQIYMEYYFIQT